MIRWTARHPLVPAALMGIVLCLGSAAVWRMPVDYLLDDRPEPLVALFTVSRAPGRDVILDRVVRPFERQVLAEPGIAAVSSRIGSGDASVEVELKPGQDPAERAGRLREVAAAVCRSAPAVTTSVLWRAPPQEQRPGLLVQLSGIDRGPVEHDLVARLRRLEGVRAVELMPSLRDSVGLELTSSSVAVAAAARDAVARAAHQRVLGRSKGSAVLTPSLPQSLTGLLAAPVQLSGGAVPLGELARPVQSPSRGRVIYRVNGRAGLFLLVYDDPALDRRSVLSVAEREVEQWAAARPGVTATVVWNRWQEVVAALRGLGAAALTGMVLAVMALALALGRVRAALVLAASVPLSLALTVILLALAGRGLDVLTLGALAVALGLLVDAAVVVGESVAAQRAGVVAGVRDAFRPIVIGGITTVVALSPLWLGLAVELEVLESAVLPLAAAIAASVVVATTVVPGLAVAAGRLTGLRRMPLVAAWVKAGVRDPLAVAGMTVVPALALLIWLGPRLEGGDRLGDGDPRDLEATLEQPTGADPEGFARTMQAVEQKLAALPGVEHVFAAVAEDRGWLWLRLERGWETGRRRREVVAAAFDELRGGGRHIQFQWRVEGGARRRPMAGASDEGGELRWLGVRVSGDEERRVTAAAARVWAAADQPWAETRPSRRQVVVEPRLPGVDLGRVLGGGRDTPVTLVLDGRPVPVELAGKLDRWQDEPVSLAEWLDTPAESGVVPSQAATASVVEDPVWPPRSGGVFELRRDLMVTHRRMSLENLREVRARLHERLRRLPMPPGVSLTVDPLEVEEPRAPWLIPVIVAVCGLFIVLGIGFDSVVAPVRVLAVLVPHLAGSVLVLWLLRIPVNEAVVLGGLLLIGVAVNSGVLLEDRYRRLRTAGVRQRQAAARAGIERVPAVLLTAATSILAVLPLWLGGVNQLGRPFVAVLGGGLLLGTPATIVLVPALEALGAPRRRRRALRWRGDGSDVVELRSLSRSYGPVRALRQVTTTLSPGLIGLLGPNGAGKTTLIRTVVGALRADTGDVWVNGIRRSDDPEGWRALVGYLPQAQAVPMTMEAESWLQLWAAELGLADSGQAVAWALEAMGVTDLADRRLGELSGGQRRRVRVARALLGRPSVLIVDEPTTGLDPEAKVDLRCLLSELARERIVLLSTHIPEDVATACTRVLVMTRGRLLLDGSVDELLERARGKVRQRLVGDAELRQVGRAHRVVSRVRLVEGIRVRYLTDAADDEGEAVAPTLEEAYLRVVAGESHRVR